jgi:hypothetical protein
MFNEEVPDEPTNKTSPLRRILSLVSVAVISYVLSYLFENVFGMPYFASVGLAMFLALVVSYPIRIQGSINGWSNDKIQWTFLSWSIFSAVMASLLCLVFYLLD